MPEKLVVPQLGESVVEATVGRWRKSEGDPVGIGEVVVELETEKVDLEVGATHGGVLAHIEHKEGETVKIGDVLALIEESGSKPAAGKETPKEKAPTPKQEARTEAEAPKKPAPSRKPEVRSKPEAADPAPGRPASRATPSARRLALEKGVDIQQVPSTPEGAPITPDDVDAYARSKETAAQEPEKTESGKIEPGRTEAPRPAQPESPPREERVRMSRRRLTIATRLVEALRTTAMVTTFNDVDMSAVMELRRRHKESFKERYGVGLGIVSFFIKAAIVALRAYPRLNAEIQGEEMVLKHYYDIGVAVGASGGLVVPVLRNADLMSFQELEQAIKGYGRKAEQGSLTLDDLRGGTFTISNGGVFGSLLSTPILNPPQVGILGLHRIEDRPVSVDGSMTVRPMMYLALSYDHRIVDGLEAVQFLRRIKDLVENPEDMLLET